METVETEAAGQPFVLSDDGWVAGILRVVSPNQDERPEDVEPSLIVIHAISLPPNEFGGRGVEQLFTNSLDPSEHPFYREIENLRVSAHFFIRRNGRLVQFVSTHARAWHAGVSEWQGRERCNDFSLGIELEGCDTVAFEPEQYRTLRSLIACLQGAYSIRGIASHRAIAPTRKTDPGPMFDWQSIRDLLPCGILE